MGSDRIQVIILAPTLAERVGLRTLIEVDEVEVIAEAARILDIEDDLPDADVLFLQGDSILDRTESIRKLEPQLALLWISDDLQAARKLRGLPLRSWGILPTDTNEDELLSAISAIYQGLVVAPQRMLETLWMDATDTKPDELIESLTPRESEVLQLLAQGMPNKQIALELEISEHTVKFHISSIYTKLNATNRTEAVRVGLRLGLISL